MSLSPAFVEAIFAKLTLVYGQQFLRRWQDLDLSAVKDDWAHELAGLEANPKRIAYALQNLPVDKPPTVLEFRAIAWKMPIAGDNALIEMKAHKGTSPSLETLERIAAIRREKTGSGVVGVENGLTLLKQAIADAVGCSGGDEAATLARLDRMLAPKRQAVAV